MNKTKTYQKNPSVVCTELDDCAVLLNLDSKYYYNLNETGLRIWQIIEEFQSPLEIAKKLADEYEIDTERAKANVVRLVEELEKEHLIIPIKRVNKVSGKEEKRAFVEPGLLNVSSHSIR